MDEKYKVIYRFKFHYQDHVCEFNSLTDAVAKFNEVLNIAAKYNVASYKSPELDYVKIKWGTAELQCYEFE